MPLPLFHSFIHGKPKSAGMTRKVKVISCGCNYFYHEAVSLALILPMMPNNSHQPISDFLFNGK